MRVRMNCNSRQNEILGQFCDDIGADLVDVGVINKFGLGIPGDRIIVKDNIYSILQNYLVAAGPCCPLYYGWSVQVSTPCLTNDCFRFKISCRNVLNTLNMLFTTKNIKVRDPAIDREFIVEGNDEQKVRRFFGNQKIRKLIHDLNKDRAGWTSEITKASSLHPKLAKRLYVLRLIDPIDIFGEMERLKALLGLLKEMLDQLTEMGSVDIVDLNNVFSC